MKLKNSARAVHGVATLLPLILLSSGMMEKEDHEVGSFFVAVLLVVLTACSGEPGSMDGGAAQQRPSGSAEQGRPNVLLVVVDTLRADRLTSYGYARPTTPNIDRELAGKGVTLEAAYSQSPWTLPSMISLFTSRYPGELLSSDPTTFKLPADLETLPEQMRGLGYRTGGFVANALLQERNGFARGFDTYYFPPVQRDHRRHAENVTSRALDWLAGGGEEPFFLYLHFMDPHDPYDNSDLIDGRSPFYPDYNGKLLGTGIAEFLEDEKQREDPTSGVAAEDIAHLGALYDMELRYLDRAIGAMLAAIPPQTLANTLIVFTADHGEELYDHGWWLHARTVFEELIRVPLIVRWDQHLPAGRRLAGTVRLLDLTPTIISAAGGMPSSTWAGIDLLPHLAGTDPIPRLGAFASAGTRNRPLRAGLVLEGKKLVVFNRNERQHEPGRNERIALHVDRLRMSRQALYDLRADPHERENLLLEEPDHPDLRRLQRGIHGRLDRQLNGLRVIASGLAPGSRLTGRLEIDPSAPWVSYFLADADVVEQDGSEIRFELTADSLDKGFVVQSETGTIKTLEAAINGVPLAASQIRTGGAPWKGAAVPVRSLQLESWPAASEKPTLNVWHRCDRTRRSGSRCRDPSAA